MKRTPLALRFHFPSSVSFHNSPDGIERGNIIRWERSAEEHFGGEDFIVEARFDKRSVLLTTAAILGAAFALVIFAGARAGEGRGRGGRRERARDTYG